MSQLELTALLDHLKAIGCIQASITTPEGLRIEIVLEVDPFAGIDGPKTPSGDDFS